MPCKDRKKIRENWKKWWNKKIKDPSYRERHRRACEKWNKKNPKKRIDIGKNCKYKKFGCTVSDYNRLFEEQSGACKICGKKYERTLHFDHCHKTKTPRGLLCDRCNLMIGMCNDDVEILKMAIIYLNKYAYTTSDIGYPRQNASDGQELQRLSDTAC